MSEKEKLNKCISLLRPEADEVVKQALNGLQTTKDGYGLVMSYCSKIAENSKTVAQVFLLACVEAGYPSDTADQIKQIMGWC